MLQRNRRNWYTNFINIVPRNWSYLSQIILSIPYFCTAQISFLWWVIIYTVLIITQTGIINIFGMILLIIISATYVSLLERHIVAVVQQRVGPTTSYLGLLQPLIDAFKLLSKEPTRPYKSYYFLFRIAPIYTFTVAIFIWTLIPFSDLFIYANIQYNLLAILALFTLNNYGIIFGAWASQNKYSILSGYRTVALTSSYGISLSLILWYPAMLSKSYNLHNIVDFQSLTIWFIIPGLPAALLFWIILLTEIKKIPFDVTESEAELGSGYLVEYSGMGFALYIISEYSYILIFLTLFIHSFLGGWTGVYFNLLPDFLIYGIKLLINLILYLLIRASLPNYRFDFIMSLHWRCLFPITLAFVFISTVILHFPNYIK